MGEILYFFIMAVLVLGAGWLAYRLILRARFAVFFTFLGGAALSAAYLGVKTETAQGWDAIGYFAALVFFLVPVLAALVVGGVVGLLRRNRG